MHGAASWRKCSPSSAAEPRLPCRLPWVRFPSSVPCVRKRGRNSFRIGLGRCLAGGRHAREIHRDCQRARQRLELLSERGRRRDDVRRAGEENGKVKVEALQVVCPHAGCAIAYEPGEKGGRFFCPCHSASFDLEGKRNQAASPSPRDMDSLAVEILDGGKIRVRFQTFSTGTARKAVQT